MVVTRTDRTRPVRRGGLHLPPGPHSPRGLVWVAFAVLFLPEPLRSAIALGGPRGWLAGIASLIGIAAFSIGGWYCMAWLRTHGDVPASQIWPWLAVLAASVIASACTLGTQGLTLVAFLVILIGFALPWWVTAAAGIPSALLFYFGDRLWYGASAVHGVTLAAVCGGAGAAVGRISAQRRYQNELLRRREHELEIADTRNQMARDLHDLLGHSLTAISVKVELADRLIDTDQGRAHAELGDVRALTRSALAEVRATVNNYREVSLAAEIARAHQMLAAAEIRHELPGAIDDVPEDLRLLFAWALREAVTNVVRHSGAQHCRVTLARDSITVVDDGRGASRSGDAAHPEPGGNGLTGLRQRAAEAGAVVRVGPAPDATPTRPGFQLVVDRPVAAGQDMEAS